MDWTAIVITLLILLTLLSLFLAVRYYILSQRTPRERFAFWAFGAILGFACMALFMLSTQQTPWIYAINYFAETLGSSFRIPSKEPQSGFAFMAGLIFLGLIWLAAKLHSDWSGAISVRDQERRQEQRPGGLLTSALSDLTRRVRRQPEVLWRPGNDADREAALRPAEDSLVWREQAAELLALRSPSIRIDLRTDWHDRPGVWIGSDRGGTVGLVLVPVEPDTPHGRVREAIDWARSQSVEKQEVHIAVRGSTDEGFATAFPEAVVATEDSLLTDLVDWTDYRAEICRRFTREPLAESTLALADVYVHPRAVCSEDDVPFDLVPDILEWLEESTRRQLALLGEYGMGKSTTALALTHHLLEEAARGKSVRIPLLIELRGRSPRNQQPLELLGAWAAPFRISPRALMRLHAAGRLLLIFEGFDEMALIGDARERLQHFVRLWEFAFPQAKIILTGRPNFFLDEPERRRALGIAKPALDRAWCDAWRLSQFGTSQIALALRHHPPAVREQILGAAAQNERFRELVSRPSILHVAASFWEREHLAEKTENLTAGDVMGLFVRSSYRRQGLKEGNASSFMALSEAEREYFMVGISCWMFRYDLPNQIDSAQLDRAIERLIELAPPRLDSSSIAGQCSLSSLSDRIRASDKAIEHIKTDVRTCGLLVDDPTASGTFRFGHKSIMEYLFATLWLELARDGVASRLGWALALRNGLGLTTASLTRSEETLAFVADGLKAAFGNAKEEYTARAISSLSISKYNYTDKFLLALCRAHFVLDGLAEFGVALFKRRKRTPILCHPNIHLRVVTKTRLGNEAVKSLAEAVLLTGFASFAHFLAIKFLAGAFREWVRVTILGIAAILIILRRISLRRQDSIVSLMGISLFIGVTPEVVARIFFGKFWRLCRLPRLPPYRIMTRLD